MPSSQLKVDPKRNFANLRGGGIIRRVVPDEDTGLIHVQQMPVDENDDNDDNDDSDDGSDRTENEMDTDVSDEQMPSSSDDEFLHMHDNSDSMDENNHMDPNEFLRQVVEDDDNDNDENNIVDRRENATSSRIVQPRSIANAEFGIADDIMDWTTTSDHDDNDGESSRRRYSWPLLSSSRRALQQRSRLQFTSTMPLVGNVSLNDRIMMPPHNLRTNSMNSLRTIRSEQSRGYFHPLYPDRSWSFSHLS